MTEQAQGQPTGGAAEGGGLPLPPTRSNFLENMRAKTAQQQSGGQAPANQQLPLSRNAANPQLGSGATAPPVRTIADRAREAERQARSTDAQPSAAPEAESQEPVSRETPPETSQEPQAESNASESAPEPGTMTPEQLLAKAQEWQNSPTLPEDFLDKLIECKVVGPDGQKRVERWTIRDAKEGVMRQYDYSRSLGQIRQQTAELGQREQRYNQHFETIQDPEKFIERHEDMGYSEVLDKALLTYAERKQQQRALVRAAGIDAMNRFGCDANDKRVHDAMERTEAQLLEGHKAKLENRRLAREREALQQQTQQRADEGAAQQRIQTLKKSLDQLRPVAFKAYGVADNGANETDFYRHLKWVTDSDAEWDGGSISIEHCMKAAQGLAEELGDRRGAGANPPARGKGQPLPPTRLAGPGGQRVAAAQAQNEGRRPSDFAKQYLKRGF